MYHTGLPFQDEIGLLAAEPYVNVTGKNLSEPPYRHCAQAAHVVIHAATSAPVIRTFKARAAVYMQMRFDGHLGFPGGMVDPGETPEDAVNRELIEESGLQPGEIHLTEEHLIFSHYSPSKNLILHLFAKKVPLDLFCTLESKTLKSREWANEVMGVVRVPLYTMADGYRGFPAFLNSNFIGNSKEQLLSFLAGEKLLTPQELQDALAAQPLVLPVQHRANKQPIET